MGERLAWIDFIEPLLPADCWLWLTYHQGSEWIALPIPFRPPTACRYARALIRKGWAVQFIPGRAD